MIIKNINVYNENGYFESGELYVDGEFLSTEPPKDCEVLDGGGNYAIPGLVDIHIHGCAGADLSDATTQAIRTMARYQASVGVTAICPAGLTLSSDRLIAVCQTASNYEDNDPEAAEVIGVNLEGPFLSPGRMGAQNPAYQMMPDVLFFRQLQQEAKGLIKMLSVAPELPGAQTLIQTLKDDVTVSLAHTTADYKTSADAFVWGAKHVTHLFNAMPPFGHRDPGVIGAAMDSDCTAELICDGVHLHPSTVRAAFRMYGENRLVFVSDSMMATGMPDGQYELGELAVKKIGRRAVLTDDGSLAGSVTNLMDCMRTAVLEMGIPLASAVKCASTNPAKRIGAGCYGAVSPGKYASLSLLDESLNINTIMHKGRIICRADDNKQR